MDGFPRVFRQLLKDASAGLRGELPSEARLRGAGVVELAAETGVSIEVSSPSTFAGDVRSSSDPLAREIVPCLPGSEATARWIAPGSEDSLASLADLEAAWLVAETEGLLGIWLGREDDPEPCCGEDLGRPPFSARSLLRRSAWKVTAEGWKPAVAGLVKCIPAAGWTSIPRNPSTYHAHRRGPYFSTGSRFVDWTVFIHDISTIPRVPCPVEDGRPAVLVLAPFLARGGAEHTLYETMRCLQDRYRFSMATLAPHRPERGDRRSEFREIAPRLYSLGDLMHPAGMVGVLISILRSTGARIVYNANGTTLFYDFAPQLKAAIPDLVILDHLYDHRIGYIDRYSEGLPEGLDACIAENHRIADTLTHERGVEPAAAPVVWPCGRAPDDLPGDREAVRRRTRAELGLGEDVVVFLVAARLHPQKRPFDLIELAKRFRDSPDVHFLWAGGGDLEDEFGMALRDAEKLPVTWLGLRTDVPALILAADVGCLVSDYEGLPVFLLECLQLGRPFLGTDVGDLGRVLEETQAGIVIEEPGDIDGLETAVQCLLDPAERATFAHRALEAGPRFAPAACADRYAEAFEEARRRVGDLERPAEEDP